MTNLRHPLITIATFLVGLILISTTTAIPQTHNPPVNNPTVNVEGRYNVAGTNPDGGEYHGNLHITSRGSVYQLHWNTVSQSDGIGVRNGRILAVAFAGGGDANGCGVVDYTILNDGTLDGIWAYWGMSANGTERATHVSGRGITGEYSASGTQDGKPYRVNISVQAAGRGYKFVWSNNTEGFGIQRRDHVAVGIGDKRCGFVAYEIQADGSLDGMWGGYGTQQIGTEKATRQ